MPPKDRPGADAGSAAPGYISVHSAPAPVRPDISQIIIVATMKRFFIAAWIACLVPGCSSKPSDFDLGRTGSLWPEYKRARCHPCAEQGSGYECLGFR